MNDEGVPFEDQSSVPDIQPRSKPGLSLVNFDERAGIVSARGTGDGLTLRLDGRARLHDLKRAISSFMESRQGFLSGNPVSLEWIGQLPDEVFIEELSDFLREIFKISVKESTFKSVRPGVVETPQPRSPEKSLSLFDGVESFHSESQSSSEGIAAVDIERAALFDDADARIMLTTLRSGQRIETEHSLVICGDVNFGAEVVAGGDVIVLGTLRGVAHAGAFDETGGGRFIFSLDLRPTQLRIGAVISRGGAEPGSGPKSQGPCPEIARVEGDRIVVESYQARARNLRVSGK